VYPWAAEPPCHKPRTKSKGCKVETIFSRMICLMESS